METSKTIGFDLNTMRILSKEAIESNPLNEDFESVYKNAGFLRRYILKSNLEVFCFNDKLGFIWKENIKENYVNIRGLYFQEGFIHLPESIFDTNKFYTFETTESYQNVNMLSKMGFYISEKSIVLHKKLETVFESDLQNISFHKINSMEDMKIRTEIQNSIFKEQNRIDLNIVDIACDMKQKYYIKDLSIIMKYKKIPVAYGQVIFFNNQYLVVNFGVVDKYRNKGYGRALLNKLISICKEKKIQDLYIRVSEENIPAANLYYSLGFQYGYKALTWNK